LDAKRGWPGGAIGWSRKASAAVLAHAASQSPAVLDLNEARGLINQRADFFRRHLSNLRLAADARVEPVADLGREAFEIGQWAMQSEAAAAIQKLSLRIAS